MTGTCKNGPRGSAYSTCVHAPRRMQPKCSAMRRSPCAAHHTPLTTRPCRFVFILNTPRTPQEIMSMSAIAGLVALVLAAVAGAEARLNVTCPTQPLAAGLHEFTLPFDGLDRCVDCPPHHQPRVSWQDKKP